MPFRSAERPKAPPVVRPAGRRKAPPVEWERLCLDVRPLVLGNLSLRQLARAAATCREFWEAYHSRLTEERGRLKLFAEETLGKKKLAGFVTALQGLLSGTSHDFLRFGGDNRLVIYADANSPPNRLGAQQAGATWCNTSPVPAVLYGRLPESRQAARISIQVGDWGSGVSFVAWVSGGAGPAAVGLMLSICTGNAADICTGNPADMCTANPGDMPATRGTHLSRTILTFEGLEGVVGRREARVMVGPLRPLSESFAFRADNLSFQSRFSSGGQAYPVGHFEISCRK
jgi:hypothetical protein